MPPRLVGSWHVLAPDIPGCAYSATPDGFRFDFDGYSECLGRFCDTVGVRRPAVWLHDFGSQIGLRLAIARPGLVGPLIVQNGDIHEDELGPGYVPLPNYWNDPSPQRRAELAAAITQDGFREEFLNGLDAEPAAAVPPDPWPLHWSLMTPRRWKIAVEVIAGLRENLAWFPRYQQWLHEHQPPTLIVWGARDSTCRPAPPGPTYGTCLTRNSTSSTTPATGCSTPTSTRSPRS